jgi:hypothetical protein
MGRDNAPISRTGRPLFVPVGTPARGSVTFPIARCSRSSCVASEWTFAAGAAEYARRGTPGIP